MGKSNAIICAVVICIPSHAKKRLSLEIRSINSDDIRFFNGMTLRTAYVIRASFRLHVIRCT